MILFLIFLFIGNFERFFWDVKELVVVVFCSDEEESID